MNDLIIPLLPHLSNKSSISQISTDMDFLEKHRIAVSPWPVFPYKPVVDFTVAHSGDSIFLKFYVTEQHVVALNLITNGPVYNDSCVEFFISWGDEQTYYNLEFNCAGTCNFGYGPAREKRALISKELIKMVRYQSVFKSVSTAKPYLVNWELSLMVPLTVFSHHNLGSFNEQSCRVNFYKCGDLLPEPHYLSWTDIKSDKPNFHLPEFFRKAYFSGDKNKMESSIFN